ncbi:MULTISPECIES: fimbrial protein [unclassified Pseudomonas]|uniref:fimbrial protein n=1 Tax=unclassified Pseudomonas TaxID=196821 RepID=UPI001304F852|nr:MULTISPECIES: fimbrial protein [unclassified Pseudomonas]
MRYSVMLTGLLASMNAMADCSFVSGAQNATMTFQFPKITVGRNVPVGAEVYRQDFVPGSAIKLNCLLNVLPYLLIKKLSGTAMLSGFGPGVYSTGVTGIGVKYLDSSNGNQTLPTTGLSLLQCVLTACPLTLQDELRFTVSFIKTSDTVVPGTLQGSALPAVQNNFGLFALQSPILTVTLSGGLQVVSQTCQTPNVTVPMGTRRLSDISGTGYTEWQRFSISLNNCPPFYGSYSLGSSNTIGHKLNSITFQLDPTKVGLPAQGILNLNSTGLKDVAVARGIGLQIALDNEQPIVLSTPIQSGITIMSVSAGYAINLKARYVKLPGQTPTSGTANATATFTMNYQ